MFVIVSYIIAGKDTFWKDVDDVVRVVLDQQA